MIAFLDGQPVQIPNDTLRKPKFTLVREDEAGDKVLSFAGDLEFEGADAAYIKQRLVDDPNAINNSVELRFKEDCCPNVPDRVFVIKAEGVEWCDAPNCTLTAQAVEFSQASQYADCLKSTLIFDNYAGFQSQQHPRITYCNELRPAFLQDALIITLLVIDSILLILSPIIAVIAIIVSIINAIIAVVNVLCSNCLNPIGNGNDIDGGIISWALNFFSTFNDKFIGCGRKHPSPFVRSYAQNVCAKCGLQFQSSIYNNPGSDYYNTVYWNAPVRKGVDQTDNTTYWIDDNKPLLNGHKFFNQLKPPTNSRWKIIGNTVVFERRDYFQSLTPWLDITTYDPDKIVKVCYEWSKKQRYAYANLQYMQDAIEWVGDEARPRWNDIVEWNSPYSSLQKDEYALLLQYGAARFRGDGIDRDVLSDYSNFPLIGPIISQWTNVQIMHNGTAFNPKLLIYDDTTPHADARVRIYYPPGNTNAALNQHYNYPFWFDQSTPGNLYDRFISIDNPRNAGYIGLDVTIEIAYDCATLAAVNPDGTVMTSRGLAEVQRVEIDHGVSRMTIYATL
jgi:hypothetical protein